MVLPVSEYPTVEPFLPERLSLKSMREASKGCRGCPLYRNATQTVFGEGPGKARVMFIGEQPGDQEDLAGRPFVGPAGKVLDEGLAESGIDRGDVYLTNAVKHFKFEPRGTRRIHAKPNAREMAACKPWLMGELQAVKPEAIVCLGATAAQDLMGKPFKITRERGRLIEGTPYAPVVMATYHPSAILRMPDRQMRDEAKAAFWGDLKRVKEWLG